VNKKQKLKEGQTTATAATAATATDQNNNSQATTHSFLLVNKLQKDTELLCTDNSEQKAETERGANNNSNSNNSNSSGNSNRSKQQQPSNRPQFSSSEQTAETKRQTAASTPVKQPQQIYSSAARLNSI